MDEPAPIQFTSRPTTRSILENAAEVTRHSAVVLTVGAFASTVAAIAIYLGDRLSILLLLLGLSMLSGVFILPFVWWAIHRRRDLVLAAVDVQADPQGISFHSPTTTSRQEWTVYRRARETSRAFLLDTGAGAVVLLSKREVDGGEVTRFRELLRSLGLLLPAASLRSRLRPLLWIALGMVLGLALTFGPRLLASVDQTATMAISSTVDGSTVTIEGTTDLPDGAVVVLTILQADEWARESADGAAPDPASSEWIRDATATVADGRFQATLDTDGWPAGRGLATAYFWVDFAQPTSVIDRFAADGSGLRGPDVADEDGFGPTLRAEQTFQIGG